MGVASGTEIERGAFLSVGGVLGGLLGGVFCLTTGGDSELHMT